MRYILKNLGLFYNNKLTCTCEQSISHANLLYILNLLKLPMTTKQKIPNMGKIPAKSDQFSITVAGYKWSREVVIFGKVTEKGSTIKLALLEFRLGPQVFSK